MSLEREAGQNGCVQSVKNIVNIALVVNANRLTFSTIT